MATPRPRKQPPKKKTLRAKVSTKRTPSHSAPEPTKASWRPRWSDLVALVGLGGFIVQVVDRYATGQPADPTLTFFSVLLATGAVSVPRVRDALLRRYGGV